MGEQKRDLDDGPRRYILTTSTGSGRTHALRVRTTPFEDALVGMSREQLEEKYVELSAKIEAARKPSPASSEAELRKYLDRIDSYLFQRRMVADKIAQRSRRDEIGEIKEAVESKVADPEVRQELSDLVTEVARRQDELAARLDESDDAVDQELRKIEVQQRRWDMRKSMLEREPAAVLIGGLLLLVLTLALIIATFSHTTVPDVLTNMILLILGFFFGQTTSTNRPGGE
ncbi:hypothetical protein [Nocardia wallacei]|uniref:hypothetical protein n=1 Tax=Nocardia wallacei TaxID=480035 RepID=UPI002453F515|nr:hypothetical protein [Nocardia wallacei]